MTGPTLTWTLVPTYAEKNICWTEVSVLPNLLRNVVFLLFISLGYIIMLASLLLSLLWYEL